MISHNKISIAAKNFFERFGNDAPAEAKRRAQEMQIFGKTIGYATWMMILKEVKAMVEEGSGETRH
jgi:hypothetical protein